ncbi:MAG: acetolactate synthase small subunit [Proteobacteria bacterium]|nr:acetolactate synthase small subunit [Pseudomonadota bacterium]
MVNSEKKPAFLVALLVEDHPGVTMKIAGMFARRGINITSFTGAPSEKKGLSRIVMTAEGDSKVLEQIYKQMNKLVDVVQVRPLLPENATLRELALVKLTIKDENDRQAVMSLNEIFRNKIIDVTTKTLTVEVVGGSEKIDSFVELVSEKVTIRELSRSGTVALYRGEDSVFLD